ncbi:MAG: O-antigen polymerase [Pseudomonadota bacterium]
MTLVLLYTAFVLAGYALARVGVARFDVVFSLVLFISAFLGTLPLLEYPQEVRFDTQLLMISVHLAVCMGYNALPSKTVAVAPLAAGGNASASSSRKKGAVDIPRHPLFEKALTTLAGIFVLVSVASWGIDRHIPLSSNVTNLYEIRASHTFVDASGDFFTRWLRLLSHFAFLYVVMSPLYARGSVVRKLFTLLCAIAMIDLSLATGARAAIVFMALATLACYASVNKFTARQMILAGLGAMVMFYVLGGLFYMIRNPYFSSAPELFLRHNCVDAAFHPLFEYSADVVKAMLLSSCYYSSPPLVLQNFLDATRGTWTPRMGSYTFSILFRDEFAQTRLEIADVLTRIGLSTNPWATFTRDLYVDFGYAMALPAFVIGIFLRFLVRWGHQKSDVYLARNAMLALAGFVAAFLSPFVIRQVVYPVLITIALPMLLPLLPSKSRSKTPSEAPPLSPTQP